MLAAGTLFISVDILVACHIMSDTTHFVYLFSTNIALIVMMSFVCCSLLGTMKRKHFMEYQSRKFGIIAYFSITVFYLMTSSVANVMNTVTDLELMFFGDASQADQRCMDKSFMRYFG